MQDQQKLDKGAKTLMTLIKAAEAGATDACENGDWATSANLHRVAGYLRLAYAEGREIRTAGGIRPAFGGDGK